MLQKKILLKNAITEERIQIITVVYVCHHFFMMLKYSISGFNANEENEPTCILPDN